MEMLKALRQTIGEIEQSVERAVVEHIDQPLSDARISQMLASINGCIQLSIQKGELMAGAATYNPAENPVSQINKGQLVFDLALILPLAKRLAFSVCVDTTLLSQ